MMNSILGWHIIGNDKKLSRYVKGKFFNRMEPSKTTIRVGQTLKRDPDKVAPCMYGLHASERLIDAAKHTFYHSRMLSGYICRVKLHGHIIKDYDKHVASKRTCLGMIEIDKVIQNFSPENTYYFGPLYNFLFNELDFTMYPTVENYCLKEMGL